MSDRLQIAGLVSASASTAARIYVECREGRLNADMPVVIANTNTAGEKLDAVGYPNIIRLPRKKFATSLDFGKAMLAVLEAYGIGFVGLWGWDPLIPDNVIEHYYRRMTNQHGDLPQWFGGAGMNGIVTICARLNFAHAVGRPMGVEPVSQWVSKEVDGGDVVAKGFVTILPDDTCETLYDRVKLEEHCVQIATVAAAVRGELTSIEVQSPVAPGEAHLLEQAKIDAIAHHANQTQSQLKRTNV